MLALLQNRIVLQNELAKIVKKVRLYEVNLGDLEVVKLVLVYA